MNKTSSNIDLRISSGFYILLAIALLAIPLQWLVAWLFAATIHEIGHIAAILWSGHRIEGVTVSFHGAKIITGHLDNDEWYCALAGPLMGAFLVPLIRYFPRLGICAAVQTLVNMLPVFPLDGGRVVRGLLSLFFSMEKVDIISHCVDVTVLLVGIVLAWLWVSSGRVMLFIPVLVFFLLKVLPVKIPCKRGRKWVQ